MTPSILRKVAQARAPGARRSSDVGMVLAICIGTVFVPVIGLCAAAMSDATAPAQHRAEPRAAEQRPAEQRPAQVAARAP
jgi:hypothetical protein